MASRSLGTLTIDLVAKTFGFEQGMDRTSRAFEKRVKELERSAKAFGTAIGSALAIGVTAAGAALAKITSDAVNYADQLDELSNRLGISTEQLSAWGYAAKLTGSDLDALSSAIPKLSKNLASAMDEGSRQAELFSALGISVTDAAGNLRDVEGVLPEIADRFKQLDNDTTEAALAMELFGKSGPEFLEFLNLGSDGLQKMAGEAQDLGAIVGGETAAQAAQFKDELDKLAAASTGLGTQIAAQLLPAIVGLVGDMTDWVKQGDLARNITTLLTAAVNVGVGALDLYRASVDNVSIAIEQAIKSYEGWTEVTKNVASLGFADGSVADGFRKISQAADTAAEQRRAFGEMRGRPSGALDDGIDFTKGAPTSPGESSALDKRVSRYLKDADGKSKAAKATKELTAEEKKWAEWLEEMAVVEGVWQEAAANSVVLLGERDKAMDDALAEVDRQISDMQFEYDLLGKTNRERAQEIELRYAGADATDEQRQKIVELSGAIYDQNHAIERQVEAMDSVRDSAGSFFRDLKDGVAPLDALTNAVDRLVDKLYDLAVDGLIEQLLGQMGDTGGGASGGWLNAFASLFGVGKANGGWAMPNTLYEVNERGMEMATVRGRDYLLTGSSPVQITPNHRLGGGGAMVTFNNTYVNPQMADARSESQRQQREAEQLRIAARNS